MKSIIFDTDAIGEELRKREEKPVEVTAESESATLTVAELPPHSEFYLYSGYQELTIDHVTPVKVTMPYVHAMDVLSITTQSDIKAGQLVGVASDGVSALPLHTHAYGAGGGGGCVGSSSGILMESPMNGTGGGNCGTGGINRQPLPYWQRGAELITAALQVDGSYNFLSVDAGRAMHFKPGYDVLIPSEGTWLWQSNGWTWKALP